MPFPDPAKWQSLTRWKDALEVVKIVVTIGAVIVGGLWTYKLFVEHREAYAKADISHEFQHLRLEDGRHLVRLTVSAKNTGNVLLRIAEGDIRIEKVLPISPIVEDAIRERADPITDGEAHPPWPLVRGRKRQWDLGTFEIEPGETDQSQYYDFLIPGEVEAINAYTHFGNVEKQGVQAIGWAKATLFDLRQTGLGAAK